MQAEQTHQMQQIIRSVPDGLVLLDTDLSILAANPAGQDCLSALTDSRRGDSLTHLAGHPIAELLTSPPTGGTWHKLRTDDQNFQVVVWPIESDPAPGGWVLVIQDVTQEREIQRRIEQQERLAAVGQLAAGMAHDFNNIMSVIILYAQTAMRTMDPPAPIRERLTTIYQQAKRATDLIDQILDFSQPTALEPQPFDLAPFLKEQVGLLQRTLPVNIKVDLNHTAGECPITAFPTRIQQIIMNLAINARDAMPAGGELCIALEQIEIKENKRTPLPGMAAGKWVELTVSDNGVGIPPDLLPRIFEPFFTTKKRGEGTGMGLAQVHDIVKEHRGKIDVKSEVGHGTTFVILLPTRPVDQPSRSILETEVLPQGHGETILLVENNPSMRGALMDSLEALNYRGLEAANGRDALLAFEQAKDEIALVLSDLVMPEMGGKELISTLRQLGATIPAVILTGYPQEDPAEELQGAGPRTWLQKPINLGQLAQTIAEALKESTPIN